jgi:hypothetical protein
MADSDKNILITPNRGSTSSDPSIKFTGGNNNPVTLTVLDDGTLSFSGSAGQLFSISDSLTGTIFSVNDVSGIPSIEVDDDGSIRLAEFGGNILIGAAVNAVKNEVSATSATTTIDVVKSNFHVVTMSTNTTFSLTNLGMGGASSGTIVIKQDGAGGRTFTLPSVCKTPVGGASIVQSTGANTTSILTYLVVSSTEVLVNYIGNYA